MLIDLEGYLTVYFAEGKHASGHLIYIYSMIPKIQDRERERWIVSRVDVHQNY